ncbi:MAG: DoxX family membrane protein [Bacteroidota bacterium]
MLSRLNTWADTHRDIALDLVRIYLGLGLFFRGIVFLNDSSTFFDLAGGDAFAAAGVALYVGLAHLGGGLLLALGLLTRVAALLQIPVLLGATFLIHLPESLLTANQSFAFSALVLALLSLYAVWGGGRWSLDRAVKDWSTRDEEEATLASERLRESREREKARRQIAANREPTPPASRQTPYPPCIHGYDRHHPSVVAERSYGVVSRLRFVLGTHPRPAQIIFRCQECGGVVEVATDVETLERYRFSRTA